MDTEEKVTKIVFNNEYAMMPDDLSETFLVKVQKVEYKQLDAFFIKRLTQIKNSFKYAPLPQVDLIVLIFETKGTSWQAFRRFTIQKFQHYESLVDTKVEIVIDKEFKSYLVFAGDKKQFVDYLLDQPEDDKEMGERYINISSAKDAYGYNNFEIVKVGSWEQNDWMHDVIEDLEARMPTRKGGE